MKKMIIALVAMVMMTMSVNAQSENNNNSMTFDRISSYLDLRIDQVKTVKTAMAQFNSSMEAYYQLKSVNYLFRVEIMRKRFCHVRNYV